MCGIALLATACGGAKRVQLPLSSARPLHTPSGVRLHVVAVTHPAASAERGYFFVAEKKGHASGGPMILDDRGRVVWYRQVEPPYETTDFRAQFYKGRPVLTWWQGKE